MEKHNNCVITVPILPFVDTYALMIGGILNGRVIIAAPANPTAVAAYPTAALITGAKIKGMHK